jgi:alkylation response protein AidB-like acyl-CoA dehydrogenase
VEINEGVGRSAVRPGLGELREAVRGLGPELVERAAEIESRREVPGDISARLEKSGCFRTLVPAGFGGLELDAVEVVEILTALARADGSVGWLAMIRTAAPLLLARFPRHVFESVYRDGPDVNVRGAVAPKGAAVAADGGYRVNGQWPFASGVSGARWFVGACAVMGADSAPRYGPGGIPDLRLALIPGDDVEFLDTWHSVGLCGTSSQDVRLAQDVIFQHGLGELALRADAAEAFLLSATRGAWQRSEEASALSPVESVRLRAVTARVTAEAVNLIDQAYTAAGSASLYTTSPLQRRLRDAHVTTQHMAATTELYRFLGAMIVGEAVPPLVLARM